MPVPKRKVSRARRDKRSANKHIIPIAAIGCPNCEHPSLSHQACQNCGHYKGRKVLNTKYERDLKRNEIKKTIQAKRDADKVVKSAAE